MALIAAGLAGLAVGGLAATSMSGGGSAPAYQPIDIDDLDATTRKKARQNAIESMALEKELTPEMAALRKQSTQAALSSLMGDQESAERQFLANQILKQELQRDPSQIGVPALQRSALMDELSKLTMQDLQAGGALPRDIQNMIVRASGQRAGRAGVGMGQFGRDIVARDLGLSSLDLINQRRAAAAGLGQFETNVNLQQQSLENATNQFNQQLQQQFIQNRLGVASGILGQQENALNRALGIGQSTPMPIVGLDPGQLASVKVADVNALNSANQQAAAVSAQKKSAQMGLFGSILGAGASLGGAAIAACWVAREVYGKDNKKWRIFRAWLMSKAPKEFRNLYLDEGQNIARKVKTDSKLRESIKASMDGIIEQFQQAVSPQEIAMLIKTQKEVLG